MQGNRGRDTRPELALRRELHRRGLRYRVHLRPEPGLRAFADVVFTRARVAVFVDGCFWHACPRHRTDPRTNSAWWAEKLARNVRRDRRVNEELQRAGWVVVRVWEHESPAEAAARVHDAVTRATHRWSR
jgi:DNA mismatch endonuclease (patch repair protein)